MVIVVVAAALDRAIGRGNDVPWHLPGDLRRFKARTVGKAVVMGRRTWASIGERPLPRRRNFVVTRSEAPIVGATKVKSLAEAVALAGAEDLCVLGGAALYQEAYAIADVVYLSLVHTHVSDADTHLPPLGDGWVIAEQERHDGDAHVVVDYTLVRPVVGDARPPFRWPSGDAR